MGKCKRAFLPSIPPLSVSSLVKLLPPLPNSRIRVVLRYFLILVILHPDGVDLVILIPCRVAGLSENLFGIGNGISTYDDDMLKSGVRVGAT